jgi:hypothetical protein
MAGSMAFALAMEAKKYFPMAGDIFLTITLLVCAINVIKIKSCLIG